MRYVTAFLILAALGTALALFGRMYAFPAEVSPAGVEKPRPQASFLKVDEGVLSDMASLPRYALTPAATGAEVGKPSLLADPSKSDYHF